MHENVDPQAVKCGPSTVASRHAPPDLQSSTRHETVTLRGCCARACSHARLSALRGLWVSMWGVYLAVRALIHSLMPETERNGMAPPQTLPVSFDALTACVTRCVF